MHESEFTEALAEMIYRVRQQINARGWAIQYVGGTGNEPPFAYTVGLSEKSLPEFIVCGLSPQATQAILDDLCAAATRAGVEFAAGDTVHDLLSGCPGRLVQVSDSWEHLTMANRFADPRLEAPVPALQVVLPDPAGRFGWESGSTLAHLPLLGPVPEPGQGREHTMPQGEDAQ